MVVIALLALLMGRGFTLSSGDTEIEVLGSANPVSTEQVQAQQPELEAAASSAVDDLASDQAAGFQATDISGAWFGADGFSYTFTQVGSAIAFQEFSPDGTLLTSVGEGVVVGDVVEFQVTNGFATGFGSLQIAQSGMQGQVFDQFGNLSNQLDLTR